MANVRINALTTTTTSAASDDYLALDGTTNGTRKMLGNLFALLSGATFTGNVVIPGGSVSNAKAKSLLETGTVSATAATGTVNYDAKTQSVLYYTTNASGNWTLNIRGDGTTTLDSLMAVGDFITIAFLVTQGGTAYYASALTVDGASVTPKWQGGTAPTAGNASSIDSYVYTVVKTASATFTVFAAQTQFK